MKKTELVVIGGGPGGYAAAFYAADHDMEVTLVNLEENPGGVCLYRGCIPSKALLHVAKLIYEARDAKNMGVEFGEPKIDLDKLREFKNNVVGKMTGGLKTLSKQRKITYMQGKGTFTGSNTLKVNLVDGGEEELEFKNAIIATGSRITTLPMFDIDSDRVLNSTTGLDLPEIPKTMLIIGGGYIGLELGSVYAALGSKVDVVEMMPNILPGADKDLVSHLSKMLKGRLESIKTKTKVVEMKKVENGVTVKTEDGKGETSEKTYDYVLYSIGRKPVTDGLGLENTSVETTDKGFIKIDGQRRTTDEKIFAIGDIAGEPMLAHKASHEAHVAVEAILGKKTVFEPHAIPAVVFTDPEVAWAGLTETEAKEKDIKVEVAKFPWAASGRATTLDRSDGVTKLLIDPETERILGVGIVGPGAGELIAEGVLAIEMGANATDMKLTIHPHPTLSETVMESAEAYYGMATHIYRPKKK